VSSTNATFYSHSSLTREALPTTRLLTAPTPTNETDVKFHPRRDLTSKLRTYEKHHGPISTTKREYCVLICNARIGNQLFTLVALFVSLHKRVFSKHAPPLKNSRNTTMITQN
jgi:hypothetical protein